MGELRDRSGSLISGYPVGYILIGDLEDPVLIADTRVPGDRTTPESWTLGELSNGIVSCIGYEAVRHLEPSVSESLFADPIGNPLAAFFMVAEYLESLQKMRAQLQAARADPETLLQAGV